MSSDFDRDADYLLDIIEIGQRIVHGMAGVDFQEFEQRPDLRDATAYRLLGIGEIIGKLGADIRERNVQIAWQDAVRMRHKLAHGYLDFDPERVWNTAAIDIAPLIETCRAELARRGADPDADHGSTTR